MRPSLLWSRLSSLSIHSASCSNRGNEAHTASETGWMPELPDVGCDIFDRLIVQGILIGEKRKEPGQFSLVRPASVFADFECLGVFDLRSPVLAIGLLQFGAKAIGHRFIAAGKAIAHFLMTLLLFLRIAGKQVGGTVGAAFIELGDNHAECFKLLFNNGVDGNGDFRLERIRFLK